jgi:hypothetical protein
LRVNKYDDDDDYYYYYYYYYPAHMVEGLGLRVEG